MRGNELAKASGIPVVNLYNDFEIASYAVLEMSGDDLIPLNDVPVMENRIKSVIGVGTGIGVTMIVPLEVDN